MKKVLLVCSEEKCPRKKRVDFDKSTMLKGTVYMTSACPWHVKEGMLGEDTRFFNKDHKEIFYNGE